MSNEENDDKPRARKVAKSGATTARPTFAPAEEGAAGDPAAPQGAPAASAGEGGDAAAPKRPVHDVRAPRPAPGTGPTRPDRRPPRGPRPEGRFGGPGGGGGGGGRPKHTAPGWVDAPVHRPGVPRGSVTPSLPSRDDRLRAPREDFGPPRGDAPQGDAPRGDGPPRGDRPRGPGGDRPRGPGGDRRGPRPEGGRPPRDGGAPREGGGPQADAPQVAARPAAAPVRAKPVEPPPAPKKAAASPIVVIPLARTRPIEEVRTRPALTPKEALAAKTKAAQAAKSKVEAKPAAPESMPSTLAPEWVTAGWEGALDAAKAAGHAASALVDAWVAASNVAAVAALAAAESYEGPARKAARRAVNILKARGVAIPEAPRVARPLADDKHDSVLGATFVPPDPTGAGSITITRRDPSGRYQIAEVIARDPMGILDAGGGWISGSQLRESRARVVEMFGTGPVPVPVEWARFRIAESRKQTLTAGRVLPLGLERCRDLLDPVPESEPAHPASDLEAGITGEQTTAAVAASGRLHDEPELRSWMPDRPAIDDMLRKLGERLGTDGLQDQEKVSEGLKAEIDDATDRFFSPEVRAVLVRRLRDSAISIRARKGDVRATEVLAVAKAITDAGLITSPPREIPFLVAMFQKAVSYMLQQGNGSLRIPVAAPAQQA